MTPNDFAETVKRETRQLIEGMFDELRANPGTSHYHRLDNDELFRRGEAVYQNLLAWLAKPDSDAVQSAGTVLGKNRFAEGIPLGQVLLAVLLEEKHLWQHPSTAHFAADAELKRKTTEFFQSFIYWTARGFAGELESGKPLPGRVAPPTMEHAATQKAAQQGPSELVSRGGQIGEHGG